MMAHGRQTTIAHLVLTAASSRWMVLELVGPDPRHADRPDPRPAPRPTAAAHQAALGFTQSYLAYTYGHAMTGELRDLTPHPASRDRLKPAAEQAEMRALRPKSQASRSYPSTEPGWFHRRTGTRIRSSASCVASTATGLPSRCDPQDEPRTTPG